MLSCNGELKADEYWMSAETSWIRDIARGQRDMADDQCSRKRAQQLKERKKSCYLDFQKT